MLIAILLFSSFFPDSSDSDEDLNVPEFSKIFTRKYVLNIGNVVFVTTYNLNN